MKKIVVIIAGVVVLGLLVFFNLRSDKGVSVETSRVERRDIAKVITASGSIRAKRRVNVSASAIGKVTKLAVEEGQRVEKGDFLLEIDAAPYESAVAELRASMGSAEATLELEQASLKKARIDYERALELHGKGFVSEDDLRDAAVAVEISEAKVKAARETLSRTRASLDKALHDLEQVRITADMSGVITALNVEEGESAIMGTLNNPGTVLLTIADLSEIEAHVRVDETEVVYVEAGQNADVRLDAYPDTTFAGRVTEVGNSAITSQLALGQESVDFKVVVAISDVIPNVRPGLTASVDITVAEEHGVLAVPIQSLTVRSADRLGRGNALREGAAGGDSAAVASGAPTDPRKKDIEGVFVVEDGTAVFRKVTVGIAGESYFHVVSGLREGDAVISGPLRSINEIRDGDPVEAEEAEDE